MCGEERRGSSEAVARFRRTLATLKQNGCNVLLVGADALGPACERLLGVSKAGSRYRLFVTTDAKPAAARAKLDDVRSELYSNPAAVVNWDAGVRSEASTGDRAHSGRASDGSTVRESDGRPLRERFVESADLRDLGSTVDAVVESFDAESGGLSPGELRVCVDSLQPLIAEREYEDVRGFLFGLSETSGRPWMRSSSRSMPKAAVSPRASSASASIRYNR